MRWVAALAAAWWVALAGPALGADTPAELESRVSVLASRMQRQDEVARVLVGLARGHDREATAVLDARQRGGYRGPIAP